MTRPSRQGRRGTSGALLIEVGAILLVIMGWTGLILMGVAGINSLCHYRSPRARDERALSSLAVMPLRSLVQPVRAVSDPAGGTSFHDGALVRVEGFLRADPPIAALGSQGDLYALQSLSVTHEYQRWQGETWFPPETRTDDARAYKPPRLWLDADPARGDEGQVEVRLRKDWRRFCTAGACWSVGHVDTSATVPEDVAHRLAMESVPPKAGQRWSLCAVPQGARVTVLAPAYLRQGHVVLELDKARYGVVSSEAWQDILPAPGPPWWVVLCAVCFCALLTLMPIMLRRAGSAGCLS